MLEFSKNKMNLDLWNIKNLNPPPRNTYKAKNHALDIATLHSVLTEGFSTFKDQNVLHEEAAMLSRCIYRMKLKFRSDKGLQEMEKMNRALLQYLRMNIPQILETFCSMVPETYTRVTYLPTLNMLHYILVRIQGLARVMIRVIDSAQIAAQYMELRISIGHFWKIALVCLGVISKIFVLTKEIVKFCCKFYLQLLPFTHQLKNIGSNWLPIDYSLPEDLKSWLNIDWLDQDEAVIKPIKKIIKPTIFEMVESDSEVEFCGEYTEIQEDFEITNEYVEIKDEEKTDIKKKITTDKTQLKSEIKNLYTQPMEEPEDIGELLNSNNKDKTSKKRKKQNLTKTKVGTYQKYNSTGINIPNKNLKRLEKV